MSARLKLGFFTPLPPLPTDIAHYSVRLLPALAALADVTVWTAQPKWDPLPIPGVEVRRFDPERFPAELSAADMLYFNIGNEPRFHAEIFRMACRVPGIVILHDTRLQHFFAGMAEAPNNRPQYLRQVARHYGVQAARDAMAYFDAKLGIGHLVQHYPMSLAATHTALGIIVHDRAQRDALQDGSRLPVFDLPLPYDAAAVRAAARDSAEPFRLIVFGHLSDNRRLPSILRALAGHLERERFRLDVVGTIQGKRAIASLVRGLGLSRQVTLHGFVSEPALEAALSRAHLAFNLRFPTMGEASGSQLRIWAHGLPSIVSRIGWYRDLPADCVYFVDPENDVAEIQAHLTAFLRNPAAFGAAGSRGRALLERKHGCERYARALVEIARQRVPLHVRKGSLDLARRLAEALQPLAGDKPMAEFVPGYADRIHSLLNGNEPPPLPGRA